MITVNSGFFESIRGSSRIIKGVLSEQDIIAAPLAPTGTRASLARMIGGKMMSLSNRLGLVRGSHHEKKEHKRDEAMESGRRSRIGGAGGLQGRLM